VLGLIGGARLPEAEAGMRRALDIRPTYAWGHFMLGMIMLERGDPRVALLEMQKEQQEVAQLSGLALVYYVLGSTADADAALARLIKEQANDNAFQIANVYAFRGQSDEAMLWLERAYAQKDFSLYLIKAWLPSSLVADPRYKAFLLGEFTICRPRSGHSRQAAEGRYAPLKPSSWCPIRSKRSV
jgi:predicted Zn-dependent protease